MSPIVVWCRVSGRTVWVMRSENFSGCSKIGRWPEVSNSTQLLRRRVERVEPLRGEVRTGARLVASFDEDDRDLETGDVTAQVDVAELGVEPDDGVDEPTDDGDEVHRPVLGDEDVLEHLAGALVVDGVVVGVDVLLAAARHGEVQEVLVRRRAEPHQLLGQRAVPGATGPREGVVVHDRVGLVEVDHLADADERGIQLGVLLRGQRREHGPPRLADEHDPVLGEALAKVVGDVEDVVERRPEGVCRALVELVVGPAGAALVERGDDEVLLERLAVPPHGAELRTARSSREVEDDRRVRVSAADEDGEVSLRRRHPGQLGDAVGGRAPVGADDGGRAGRPGDDDAERDETGRERDGHGAAEHRPGAAAERGSRWPLGRGAEASPAPHAAPTAIGTSASRPWTPRPASVASHP